MGRIGQRTIIEEVIESTQYIPWRQYTILADEYVIA